VSSDQSGAEGGGQAGPAGPAGGTEPPGEEELRAAYEAELSRMTSTDLIAQAVVSLLNLGARRLGLLGAPGEAEAGAGEGQGRDLEQVRDAIDAVRGMVEILERRMPQELRPLRDALAQLQMAYARELQGGAGEGRGEQGTDPGAPAHAAEGAGPEQPGAASPKPAPAGEEPAGDQGPAQRSGRLWVPGS
jgi:hypothetical protein